jgi:hypothetical protein
LIQDIVRLLGRAMSDCQINRRNHYPDHIDLTNSLLATATIMFVQGRPYGSISKANRVDAHRGPEASASRSPRISKGARASVSLRSVGKARPLQPRKSAASGWAGSGVALGRQPIAPKPDEPNRSLPRLAPPTWRQSSKTAGANSLRSVAKGLNDRGISAPRGGIWSAAQVRAAIARMSALR